MSLAKSDRPAILCMFSGGIDSSGALHQLITNAKYQQYELLIHHVHIINREKRAKAEAYAVERILNYYKNEMGAKFLFTQSTFNTTGFAPMQSPRFPFDLDVCLFIAANIAAAYPSIKKIVRGKNKTDVETADDGFRHRNERAFALLESTLMLEDMDNPEYEFPVIDFTKAEVWNSLPATVQKNTWWCRRPVYDENDTPKTCGRCSTCKEVAKFMVQ